MERGATVVAQVDDVMSGIESTARTNPELVVGVLLAGIVLGATALAILRYLRRPPGVRLFRLLGRFDDVAILMHPNPDPDAMGVAIGIRELADARGTPSTIYYSGQIRHQENRAFQTVLDLDFVCLESAGEIEEDGIVLVDHNRPRGFQGAEGIDPDIVIDHHPGDGTGSAFTDVRSTYGACASVVAEYFESLNAEIPAPGEELDRTDGGRVMSPGSPQLRGDVATGLLFGIQADTDHLTKGCTSAEFEASSYLFPAADEDLLDRIANPQVTSEMLEIKATAIQDRSVNGSFAISDVGDVSEVDAIPQAADELIRLEGISAVVVYGSKEGTIHLSGRSRDDRVHMGRTLDAVFQDVPMASAGGHARMGGGQVPLRYLAGLGPSAVAEDRARSDLRGRLFNALKGNV